MGPRCFICNWKWLLKVSNYMRCHANLVAWLTWVDIHPFPENDLLEYFLYAFSPPSFWNSRKPKYGILVETKNITWIIFFVCMLQIFVDSDQLVKSTMTGSTLGANLVPILDAHWSFHKGRCHDVAACCKSFHLIQTDRKQIHCKLSGSEEKPSVPLKASLIGFSCFLSHSLFH